MQINTKTGALTVSATGIDLSSAGAVTHVFLSIANHADAEWDYGFDLAMNKSRTVGTY